jgi:PTS system nitrogen regulatory IIA component
MELSLRDVARLLGVTEDVVARWVRQRELRAVRVGGHYRVNRVELQEWAATRGLRVSPELYAPEGHVEQLPSLHDALVRGQIHYDLEGAHRDEILRAVVALSGIPADIDRNLLLQLLVSREQLASTGIGAGIAIPHPREPLVVQISDPIVILAFLRHPVDFEAIDSLPVSTLFVLLSPSVRVHLQMLSRLMCALHDALVRELLQKKMPAEAILQRICELEESSEQRRSSPGIVHGTTA